MDGHRCDGCRFWVAGGRILTAPDGTEEAEVGDPRRCRAKMTPEQRRDRARKAAEGRWMKNLPQATHMGELRFGTLAIPCAVLEDGARVLSERGFLSAIGLYRSGTVHTRAQEDSIDGAQLPLFVANLNLKPFIDDDLKAVLSRPAPSRPSARDRRPGDDPDTGVGLRRDRPRPAPEVVA